jgi:hypothetical protein
LTPCFNPALGFRADSGSLTGFNFEIIIIIMHAMAQFMQYALREGTSGQRFRKVRETKTELSYKTLKLRGSS